jgi:hypothetical protein
MELCASSAGALAIRSPTSDTLWGLSAVEIDSLAMDDTVYTETRRPGLGLARIPSI